MNVISKIAVGISIGSVTLTIIALIVSILFPQDRVWPPQHQKSCGQYFMMILFNTAAFSLIILGVFDWDSYTIPMPMRIPGLVLGVTGNIIALWAVVTLGIGSTTGDDDGLIREGPYQHSRNPQYVGFIIGLVGWGLLTNSLLTLVASLLSIIPLVMVPRVEEPWLQMKYGKEYDEYMLLVIIKAASGAKTQAACLNRWALRNGSISYRGKSSCVV